MKKTVFAVHAHPDDIEFMMAGTLFLLKEQGWDIHYMTIADGSCGSAELSSAEIARIRESESRSAVELIGGVFHGSIAHDMEIFYERDLLARLAAIVREVAPDVMLVPSPQDYMEDHMNSCRLAVSAAFTKGVPNFLTSPVRPAIQKDVKIYHALPHGLRTGLDEPVVPDFVVDISGTIDLKEEMLARHKSQKEWLDRSQGLDSYLKTMRELSSTVGAMVEPGLKYGEGWRRHSHLGYASRPTHPLESALKGFCHELAPG